MTQSIKKPGGGFCFISAMALLRAWWAYRRGFIRLYDLRVWFACFELLARRCGAKSGIRPRYQFEEIHRLVGGAGGTHVRTAVCKLRQAGLLQWSESRITMLDPSGTWDAEAAADFDGVLEHVPNHRRLVPVPRRIIRFIAGGARRAVIATIIGQLLRCVYYYKGSCRPSGLCKASWIAEVFRVDLRNVKAARKHLTEIGWLIRQPSSQTRLNRWGSAITVNLDWSRNDISARTVSPPPEAVSSTGLPPPYINKNLSSRSENQKPAIRGPDGVCTRDSSKPTLRHVVQEDLRHPKRTEVLRQEAIFRKYITASEADRLKFFAAAEHARIIGSKNPPGLFAAMVRRSLWHCITQDDEDAARRKLRELDWSLSSQVRNRAPVEVPSALQASSDERAKIRALIERSLSAGLCAGVRISNFV